MAGVVAQTRWDIALSQTHPEDRFSCDTILIIIGDDLSTLSIYPFHAEQFMCYTSP